VERKMVEEVYAKLKKSRAARKTLLNYKQNSF
jgi:hypothetical protein